MKVRMKVRPTGYISIGGGPLVAWPNVGAVVDFPEVIAEELIASGDAEKVSIARAVKDKAVDVVEQRPSSPVEVETRVKKATDGSA